MSSITYENVPLRNGETLSRVGVLSRQSLRFVISDGGVLYCSASRNSAFRIMKFKTSILLVTLLLVTLILTGCSASAEDSSEEPALTVESVEHSNRDVSIKVNIENKGRKGIWILPPDSPHNLGVWRFNFVDLSGARVTVGRKFEPTSGNIGWVWLSPREKKRFSIKLTNGKWAPYVSRWSDGRLSNFTVEYNLPKKESRDPKVWSGNVNSARSNLPVDLVHYFSESFH